MTGIMNLDYIHKNDIHEKYVLGQLSKEEKIAYETFLKENEQAQQELQETRALLDGIRTAGTESMRAEIERQVAEIRSPKTDWSLIYKAAAILFVLVFIPTAVYFQLFDLPREDSQQEQALTETHKENEMSIEETMQESATETIAQKEEAPVQRMKIARKKSAEKEKLRTAMLEKSAPLKSESKEESESLTGFDDALEEIAGSAAGAGAMSKRSQARISAKPTIPIASDKGIELQGSDNSLRALESISSESQYVRAKDQFSVDDNESVIISIDSDSGLKRHNYSLDKMNVQMSFLKSEALKPFPDSFSVIMTMNNENDLSLHLTVSDAIYSLEKKDILLNKSENKKLSVTFLKTYTYEIELDSSKTTATKKEH
jgi:hypothetical protein